MNRPSRTTPGRIIMPMVVSTGAPTLHPNPGLQFENDAAYCMANKVQIQKIPTKATPRPNKRMFIVKLFTLGDRIPIDID